jgi:Tfp pilus assembly protein PilF
MTAGRGDHHARLLIGFAVAAVAALAAVQPARAQSLQDAAVRRCIIEQAAIDRGEREAACSALIASPTTPATIRAAAFRARGNIRFVNGALADAVADFNEAVALEPSVASAYLDRGIVRDRLGDRTGALEDLARSIAIDPGEGDAHAARAGILAALGAHRAAVDDLNVRLRLQPDDFVAHLDRGLAALALDDPRAALDDFAAVDRLMGPLPITLGYVCAARRRLAQSDAAEAACRAGMAAASPENGWPHAASAALALASNDLDRAAALLAEALRRDPDEVHALQLRAIVQARRGDEAGAAADAAAAAQRNPRIAQVVVEIFGLGNDRR